MHQIIALWSHPRSMSTAFERIMRERGDLICHHEPFMYDYYVNRRIREMPHFKVEPHRPRTYEAIREKVLADAESGPVFFKDMSYYVMPHILEDAFFLRRIHHCFLIRDPLAAILSYAKLDPEVTLEEIGLKAQWRHFEGLRKAKLRPLVVEAEAIRTHPRKVIGAVWQALDLPFEAGGFNWQKKKPEDWGQVSGWHAEVMDSDGIAAPDPDEPARKKRAFEALCQSQPHLLAYLDHHTPFYHKLKKRAQMDLHKQQAR